MIMHKSTALRGGFLLKHKEPPVKAALVCNIHIGRFPLPGGSPAVRLVAEARFERAVSWL